MVIIKNINNNLLPNNFTGICFCSFYKMFIKNNEQHRYYGPAVFSPLYKRKAWIFNSKFYGADHESMHYSQKEFIKELGKQWLL